MDWLKVVQIVLIALIGIWKVGITLHEHFYKTKLPESGASVANSNTQQEIIEAWKTWSGDQEKRIRVLENKIDKLDNTIAELNNINQELLKQLSHAA